MSTRSTIARLVVRDIVIHLYENDGWAEGDEVLTSIFLDVQTPLASVSVHLPDVARWLLSEQLAQGLAQAVRRWREHRLP